MTTSLGSIHEDLLALPAGSIAAQALEFVIRVESTPIANHSVRSYLFARLLARHRHLRPGHDYDDDLLFLACVLHDVGLTDEGNRHQRFEVDGADVAAEFLTERGMADDAVETVWEAIALHTSSGVAERRGPICRLTRAGVGLDFGADRDVITDAAARQIHAAYPRFSIARQITDAIVAQVRVRPEKGPRYSLPGDLLRERETAPHLTAIEAATLSGRWGE